MCSFQISFGEKRKRNVVDLDYDLNSKHFVDTQQLIKIRRHLEKSKEKDSTKSDANVLNMSFHLKVSTVQCLYVLVVLRRGLEIVCLRQNNLEKQI